MIRLLRRLWPSFLHRLDHKLLIHQPALWATRFHLLLAAWLVMALLIVVRAFTSPLDKLPDWVAMMGGLSLLAGLAWLVWLVSMYRFRPGRHPFSEQSGLKQLMVVLSGLLLLSSLPFVYGVSLGARHDLGNIGKEQEVEKRQELVEQSSLYFSYDGYQLERDKSRYGYATSLSILDASWLPNLQQAMEAFEDYGGDLEGRSAQSLWEDAQASRLAFSSDFRQDWEEVRVNMNRHSEAFRQYQELMSWLSFRSHNKFVHVFIFLLLLGGMAGVVLMQTNVKQFFLAMLSLAGLGILVFVLTFIQEMTLPSVESEAFVSVLVLLCYLLVGSLALGRGKKYTVLRKVAMICLVLTFPFLGLELAFLADAVLEMPFHILFPKSWDIWLLLVTPAGLGALLWVKVGYPQIKRLNSRPWSN
jgi:hypothetical protein